MTARNLGLSALVLLPCLAGLYGIAVTCPPSDPTNAMAGFFLFRAHCPTPALVEPPSRTIPDFRLKDTAGRPVALADFKDKKAVAIVFIGAECPLANQYVLRLAELQRDLGPQGLQVLAINSNAQDSAADVAKHARRRDLPFPVLVDPDQKVADLFKAERTPEAFLLDGARTVRYQGRIDDQYAVGADRRTPLRHDLKEAILDVLAGKSVRVAKTPVEGCFIGRATAATGPSRDSARQVTYARDVAPILQRHCQVCHRPGQVAPFSLLTYPQARNWSATIAAVVKDERMPPWNADPRHGEFANDTRLPDADRKVLLAWIEQGCAKGDDNDLPPAINWPTGWTLPNPDLVLTMTEKFTVPAQAPAKGIEYQHFTLPTNFTEDVWVQAIEARPGNRAVVHHMLVYIGDKPAPSDRDSGDLGVLVSYVPGGKPAIFPPGLAKRIPKGAKLVLEMHYTANGSEQVDQSSIALVFAKEPPKQEFRTRFVANRKFTIPPHARNHEVHASTTFDNDALILTLSPHMHLRGKSFAFRAVYPDQRTEILLSVPRYDFNWQHTYALKTPLQAPAGTRIECIGQFDNSTANPNNPDASQEVCWGDQSWEEMMLGVIGYINLSEPITTNAAK